MKQSDMEIIVAGASDMAAFAQVRVAMVLTDPNQDDNPIVYVNDAFQRTTGFTRSAVLGRNCRFLQGNDTDKRDVDRIKRAVQDGRSVSVDIRNYRSNGEAFTNRLIISPIADNNGGIKYYLGIQKELGDDERGDAANDQARHLNDVRMRVQSDLSLLLRSLEQPDGDRDLDFRALHRRLECLELVYDEMQLLDSQAGTVGLDLSALLSRVGVAIVHEIGRPGIRYTQAIEATKADLETSVRTALLLSELLSNAFEHAFERMDQGVVQLQISTLGAGGVRIIVSDDGIGMPKNHQFPDPYTRSGRLITSLLEGLDASLNHVRGAAGSVFIIDVPLGG